MRVGVVHTVGSPCRCAETVSLGIEALGHKAEVFDSESIELLAPMVAAECDLVIDHTDTFRGRGMYRALVRLLLESKGARLVGSGPKACLAADDKGATKACLGDAGIPTPPGIVITSAMWDPPAWLRPPLIVKPSFEHMSRGISLVNTIEEARAAVTNLLNRFQEPIVLETFIPGRELAVSVLAGPGGIEILPPLEWIADSTGKGLLSEAFKMVEPELGRIDVVQAELVPSVMDELKGFARRAFEILDLRDYARFDVRLSAGGTPFFLEANITPSLEAQEALALSARWAGLDYATLVDRMLSSALFRLGMKEGGEATSITVDLPTGPVNLVIPRGVHRPPQSTVDLARLLDVRPGERVLELGCGSGLLSIAAAKLGAGRVVAVDLDAKALETTARNAKMNGVEGVIETRGGSWYEPVMPPSSADPRGSFFDVIIATPPQTPGFRSFGPRYGGEDGTSNLVKVIEGAPSLLEKGEGRLWMLAISLANPTLLMERVHRHFADVSIVGETERPFAACEYEELDQGLFDHLVALRSAGRSEFKDLGGDRFVFRNLFLRAAGPVCL